MKLIQLTHELFTQVNDEDFQYLSQFKWHAHKDRTRYYARTTIKKNAKQVKIFMHRMINNPNHNEVCDHIDGNGLNNLRSNLRNCTRAENGRNTKPKAGHSSKFKGVHLHKDTGKWMARITIGRKLTYLGLYASEVDAAVIYDSNARELHGEFANLNFKI